MKSVVSMFIFSSILVVLASTKSIKNKYGARTLFLILGIISFIVCFWSYYAYVLQIIPDFEIQKAKYFYDVAVENSSR